MVDETKPTTTVTTTESAATATTVPESTTPYDAAAVASDVADLMSSEPKEAPAQVEPPAKSESKKGEPTKPEPAKKPEPKDGEKPEEFVLRPKKKEKAEPKTDKIKIGDKEYSVEEVQKDPSLVQKLATSAAQFSFAQKKENELLERLKTLEERVKPVETKPQAAGPPALTPEFVRTAMQPAVDNAIKTGWIPEDEKWLAESCPTVLAEVMRGLFRIGHLEKAVGGMANRGVQMDQNAMVEQAITGLETNLDNLAKSAPEFGALSDKEVREGFVEFLRDDVNPQLSAITPQFLARQYYAYCKESIEEAHRQKEEALRNRAKQPFAVGETGSTRPATVGAQTLTGIEAEVAELLKD
jgi:hypothetical protein